MSLLDIADLHVHYGGIAALRGISMRVEEGEIVTLLGSNGAGKTTCLRAISGLLRSWSGEIRWNDASLRKISADEIVRRGIGHAPEGRRVFARMSVRENLDLGAYTLRSKKAQRERLRYVLETFPRLRERLEQRAGTLSGGEQQMLAIGRALMSAPRLLMLDEPSLGLAPIMVQTIFRVIDHLNQQGTTILLVEQNARQALQIAARGYVIESGSMRLQGTGAQLLADPSVIEAYLGAGG